MIGLRGAAARLPPWLGAMAAAMAFWVASPALAGAGPGPPPAECRAYPAGEAPAGSKVYLVPRLGQAGSLGSCSIDRMAIATHGEGKFRAVYENNDAIPPSKAIDPVIDRLKGNDLLKTACDASGACVLKILIFAHGGRVSQAQATQDGEALAPAMLADGYQPLFLIWNSDDLTTYGDRLCCVTSGERDVNPLHIAVYLPSRLFGDVLASAARAPETYGKQLFRYEDSVVDVVKPHPKPSPYLLQPDEPGENGRLCKLLLQQACPEIDYPRIGDPSDLKLLNGLDQPFPERSLAYAAGYLPRAGTTAIATQIGAAEWDNMVRRTRLPLRDGVVPAPSPGETCEQQTLDADAATAGVKSESRGAFLIFFDRLACEIKAGNFQVRLSPDGPFTPVTVELYYFGHSMGALVGNEILSRHPELPWRRIVYMAAATPTRDVRAMLSPALLACEPVKGPKGGWLAGVNPWCSTPPGAPGGAPHVNLHFYSLMLHPLTESHDLELGGVVPEGSLLEWIDEMFGGPKSVEDRMFGKWTNAELTMAMFPEAARSRMTFRVFPAQADMHGPDEQAAFDAQCALVTATDSQGRQVSGPTPPRCHPIMHGEFVNYAFWREHYLCGEDRCREDDPEADGTTR